MRQRGALSTSTHDDHVFAIGGIESFRWGEWDDPDELDPDYPEVSATGKVIDPNVKPSPDILGQFDFLFRCQFRNLMSYSIDICDNPRNTSHSMALHITCDLCGTESPMTGCYQMSAIQNCEKFHEESEEFIEARMEELGIYG